MTSERIMGTTNIKTDPTKRFSTRAQLYNKYRPKYPRAIIKLLRAECKLVSSSIIADIGSGTGILSRLYLKNGNFIFGVEPNKEMREIAERLLKNYSNFKSVDGAAESTNLKGQSVDFIISGQAFHWFNTNKSRNEFLRILKPNGWAVLIWNARKTDTTPFLKAYDSLLYKYGIDYKEVNQQIPDERAKDIVFAQVVKSETKKDLLRGKALINQIKEPFYRAAVLVEIAEIILNK